jgi:hypothetical protein
MTTISLSAVVWPRKMNSTFFLLLVFLARLLGPRLNAQMRLLRAQIDILRARIPTQRIILSPAEKAELLRIGAECWHDIDGLMEVAKPATYNRWLAQMRGGRPFKAVGRPRLTQELRDVVIRISAQHQPHVAARIQNPGRNLLAESGTGVGNESCLGHLSGPLFDRSFRSTERQRRRVMTRTITDRSAKFRALAWPQTRDGRKSLFN